MVETYEFNANINFGPVKAVSTKSSPIVVIEGNTSVSARLDKTTGQMLNSYKYQNNYGGGIYSRLLKYENGIIFYGGASAATNGSSDIALATFDSTARPIKFRKIPNSSTLRAANVKDGNLYASYMYYNGTQNKTVLLKADTVLNIVYINEYTPVRYGLPDGLAVSDAGNIYMGWKLFPWQL